MTREELEDDIYLGLERGVKNLVGTYTKQDIELRKEDIENYSRYFFKTLVEVVNPLYGINLNQTS